jgi:septal ring factor EnvC (AmiA/AmiB activator)
MSKDLDEQVDKLEAAVDPNTVISVGGYNFTPAKLMVAGAIVSSILGGLYGAFEVYKDYMDMKAKIQEYVTPDLTEIYKKMEVLEATSNKSVEYTQDIKNDLKNDIRRLEGVVESVERSSKQSQRESDQAVKEVNRAMNQLEREAEQNMRSIRREVDDKIKKALDNPLAN